MSEAAAWLPSDRATGGRQESGGDAMGWDGIGWDGGQANKWCESGARRGGDARWSDARRATAGGSF